MAVFLISADGVPECRQLDPYLVVSAGDEVYLQKAEALLRVYGPVTELGLLPHRVRRRCDPRPGAVPGKSGLQGA